MQRTTADCSLRARPGCGRMPPSLGGRVMKNSLITVLAICIFCGSFAGTVLWIGEGERTDPKMQLAITPLYFPPPVTIIPPAANEEAMVAPSVQPTPELEEDSQQRKTQVLGEITIAPFGERLYLPEA